jgi:hypothetical protein
MNTEDEVIFCIANKLLKKAKIIQGFSPNYLMKYLESLSESEVEFIKKNGEKLLPIVSYCENSLSAPAPILIGLYAISVSFISSLAVMTFKVNPDIQILEKFIMINLFLVLSIFFLIIFARFHISRANVVKFAISFLLEKS